MASGEKSSRWKRFVARAKAWFAAAVPIYGQVDPRSLGLARVGLGLLLLHDLLRRIPGLATWYSNDGLLPNHAVLWRPTATYIVSFYHSASTPAEAAVMFALSGLVFAAFTAGWHTRFTHLLSFACLVSLHNRQAFTENGGDVALNLLCVWTLFLPMGARFSLDALLASLAAQRERRAHELDDRAGARVHRVAPVTSLAVAAVILQLAVIYYFNAVNKHGWTWRHGTAVRYVLYQERMVTWFGLLVRDHVNPIMSQVLTYVTLALEFTAPFAILAPVKKRWPRRVMIALLPLMHLGFAAFLNLGQFSFNMLGYFPLLLAASEWELLGKYLGPSDARARTVYVRASSPLLFGWARVLARLDAFDRLRFVSAADADPPVAGWAVAEPATGRRVSGARAVADCLAALPCGLPFALVLRAPGLRAFFDLAGRAVARRGDGVAALFRLGARYGAGAPRPETPARRWVWQKPAGLREIAAAVLVAALFGRLLVDNNAIPKRFKPEEPAWFTQLTIYPRLTQGWQMFSSDVPTSEQHLYVDAVTVTGRHVDPYNEAASRVAKLPVERIPPHMEQDEFWCDYTNRIPTNGQYWRLLKEWIFNYHLRTGRPEDRIVSFEAKLLDSDVPPPGEYEPRNFRTKVMMTERE